MDPSMGCGVKRFCSRRGVLFLVPLSLFLERVRFLFLVLAENSFNFFWSFALFVSFLSFSLQWFQLIPFLFIAGEVCIVPFLVGIFCICFK
jgi:hypothetical protein